MRPRSHRPSRFAQALLSALAFVATVAPPAEAGLPGTLVESHYVLDDNTVFDAAPGDLLTAQDRFGFSVDGIGDFDGDGLAGDLLVGASQDNASGGTNDGAVYLLLLDADGSVKAPSPYRIFENNLPAGSPSLTGDRFGISVAWLGDYDSDGFDEIAVGEAYSDSPTDSGRVWIIDIDANAVPQSAFTIQSGATNFTTLDSNDLWGYSLSNVGDWNGDGAPELVVGTIYDDDGGTDQGAIYILYLDPNPLATAILGYTKISDTEGGFTGDFDNSTATWFGSDVTAIGDLDDDGQTDLAVGARARANGGSVYILPMDPGCQTLSGPGLNTHCTVKPTHLEIGSGIGGMPVIVGPALDDFGASLAWLPDESGFVSDRLAVGEVLGSVGGASSGHVWMLTLNSDGTAASATRIAEGENIEGTVGGRFGQATAPIGDLNGDGVTDLAIGAPFRDVGGTDAGLVHVAFLNPCPIQITNPIVFHSEDDDGINRCLPLTIDESTETLHLFLDTNSEPSTNPSDICVDGLGDGGEVCAFDVRIELSGGATLQSFTPVPADLLVSGSPVGSQTIRMNWIGTPVTPPVPIKLGDLVISSDGSEGEVRVTTGSAAVSASLALQPMPERLLATSVPEPRFAIGLVLGALWIGARRRRRQRPSVGAAALVFVLSVLVAGSSSAVETVIDMVEIGENSGIMAQTLSGSEYFGESITLIDDLDGNGVRDLAVGAVCCNNGGVGAGSVFVVFLGEDGNEIGFQEIGNDVGVHGLGFGFGTTNLGDIDGNGVADLLVSRVWYGGSPNNGPIAFLELEPDGTARSITDLVPVIDGVSGQLPAGHNFGSDLAFLGDIDGNGFPEVAVGAGGDNGIYILSLDLATKTTVWGTRLPDLASSGSYGYSVVSLGDLDGDGVTDIAAGAPFQNGAGVDEGAIYVILLESSGPGTVGIKSHTRIIEGQAGLDLNVPFSARMAYSLGWASAGDGFGGTLYAGTTDTSTSDNGMIVMRLKTDGTVGSSYRICNGCGVGITTNFGSYNGGIEMIGDVNGDEMIDLAVGDPNVASNEGRIRVLQMLDSDFDRFDDNVDNCPGGPLQDPALSYNPSQSDADDDGIGDLCDVCPFVADPLQADVDGDGEGDLCEPVVVRLQPTGTTASPAWDLLVECGAWGVTEANVAVVPPMGGASPALALTCPAAPAGGICATFDGGTSSVSGPGLVAPVGVRDDAFYVHLEGNGASGQLCQPNDLPAKFGEMTTSPITGTGVAAAALSEEGVETPGLGLALAEHGSGPIPVTEIRLATGDPFPLVTLQLGPAIVTGGDTRWDVLLTGASDFFERVAFGLVAPVGTTTADMRFDGCTGSTAEPGEVRTCAGFVGGTVDSGQSWTVGPVDLAATPAGLRDHTLYVVLQGDFAVGPASTALNLPGQTVLLGRVVLSGTPDLEPALTLEGVDVIDDRFGAGTITPFDTAVIGPLADLDEVRLIGQFNPLEDDDGDEVPNLADNCPFSPNSDQRDAGGFLSTEPDSRGDRCQCGDANRDGIVQDSLTPVEDDIQQVREFLLGSITNPVIAADVEARCSVVGTPECNIRDLVVLQQAFDQAIATTPRCDAALAPEPLP